LALNCEKDYYLTLVEVSSPGAHNLLMTPAIDKIVIRDFPQLALIAWNRRPDDVITGEDAFALYEANWRFIEEDRLQPRERDMIVRLTQVYGRGLMNV
jgi:hypothetical protein